MDAEEFSKYSGYAQANVHQDFVLLGGLADSLTSFALWPTPSTLYLKI
jgi:hypothetical protein